MAVSSRVQLASGSRILITFLLLTSLPYAHSAPLPLQLPSWLQNMIPEKSGTTIADEVKCYSLPYGAIGFVSHVLTYWTIFWLSWGRKPYWPSSRLSSGKLDLVLSLIQIAFTVSIATATIIRCRSRWQFILLAVWKLTMSVTVGFWGIWASIRAIKNKGIAYDAVRKSESEGVVQRQNRDPYSVEGYNLFTLTIYFLSMTVGLVGVISLVTENFSNPQVWKITAVFGSLLAVTAVLAILGGVLGGLDGSNSPGAGSIFETAFSAVAAMAALMLVLGAFYCDWILAALAGSLVGVPSGDTAILYWTYFGAKRIPMFLS